MADLHMAARGGDTQRMLQLIGLGNSLEHRDNHARTPLHLAAWAGQEVSRLLLLLILCCVASSVAPSDGLAARHRYRGKEAAAVWALRAHRSRQQSAMV